MTKKKGLNPDIMNEISEEEIRMSGIYDTHYYNYRCRDCGNEAKIEDIVVDSFSAFTEVQAQDARAAMYL